MFVIKTILIKDQDRYITVVNRICILNNNSMPVFFERTTGRLKLYF